MSKRTTEEISMMFRGYEITVPKGTRTTHQTALGPDPKYNFVDEFDWIPNDMPILKSDAMIYGIDIPANKVEAY